MSKTDILVRTMGNQEDGPSANVQFADFDKIQPGDEVYFSKTITAEDVETFASLSGDRNPLHMDEEFAARTRFQHRVVHGMLLANYVSALVGMRCPGPGALWSRQTFRWQAPVFVGDEVHLTLSVRHKSGGARTLAVDVKALNQDGKLVMEGDGIVTALQMAPVAQNKHALSRVLAIAADVFEVSEASLETASSPDTIVSWDSLHHLSFVVALEQEFGIQFSPEEIEQLLSIEFTAVLIEEKLKERGSTDGH